MRNRKAWALVAVLAAVVGVGGVALVAYSQSRLPQRQRSVYLLPIGYWGFGRQTYYWANVPAAPITHVYRCGFFEVRVTPRSPSIAAR